MAEGTCKVCGKEPSFQCRAHFVAEINRLRTFIQHVVIDGGYEDEGDLVERARAVLTGSAVGNEGRNT